MPSNLSPRFLRIIVLLVCMLLGLAVLAQAQQRPQSTPATARAEMQALEAQLEALRKASPGDPAEMMKQVQQDLERQAELQPQPAQVRQAVRLAQWALALSIIAISLFLVLALKPIILRRR
jgi:CHASE3 domain sensor protein